MDSIRTERVPRHCALSVFAVRARPCRQETSNEGSNMIRFASTIVALAGLLSAAPAAAAIYRVGIGAGCTHASIQGAVGAAFSSAEADVIRISQTQSYTQQSILIDQVQGALVLAGGFATCQSNAPTPGARTQLNGNGNLSVVRINETRTVELDDLDIQGGRGTGSGGGVYVTGSDGAVLALGNTLVRSNQGASGGGIAVFNTDADSGVGAMQLLLFGSSAALNNSAIIGGGIQCSGATVMLFDQSHVSFNASSDNGGGIHAQNCRVELRSSGVNGIVLLSNTASGNGGGMYLGGARSQGDIYTIDPYKPARIYNNSARQGGALAVADDAQLRLFETSIEENTASAGGGAILLQPGAHATGDTRFLMQGTIAGAPAAAVECADPEACNRVYGNRAMNGSTPQPGSAILVDAAASTSAHATFRGTRLEMNNGETLSRHLDARGQVSFDGALLVRNIASGVLLDARGAANSLVVSASTIAWNNMMSNGRGVIAGSGSCDIDNDYLGTHLYRSIIWQETHPLLEAIGGIQPVCFRYLIGNDFSGFPASSDRLVANPSLANPVGANFELALDSPALDFAPAQPINSTRNGGPRVFDMDDHANRLGPQDLGAYEYVTDLIFASGFGAEDE